MCIEQDNCPKYDRNNPSACYNCQWKLQLDKEKEEKERLKILNIKLRRKWKIVIIITFMLFVVTTILHT